MALAILILVSKSLAMIMKSGVTCSLPIAGGSLVSIFGLKIFKRDGVLKCETKIWQGSNLLPFRLSEKGHFFPQFRALFGGLYKLLGTLISMSI